MVEKDCETCKEVMRVFGDYSPCVSCSDDYSNWQPSELYTAYHGLISEVEILKDKLRPGSITERVPTVDAYDVACKALQKWREWAERFRKALCCPECEGTGRIRTGIAYSKECSSIYAPCPRCAEIREEARER